MLKLNKLHIESQNTTRPVNNTKTNYTVSFKSAADKIEISDKDTKYKQACDYLKKISPMIKSGKMQLKDCDLDKLDGIQHGIKVFEGVSLKQIILVQTYLQTIETKRGCSNGCIHCFVGAKPSHIDKNDTETINQMSWEDICDFSDGFAELRGRLGQFNKILPDGKFVLSTFYDSDSMEIVVKDKNGNEHDEIDIMTKLNKGLNKPILFDTSGWNPKNEKLQKRAEKYVEFFKKDDFTKQIFISLNPFHKLNSKYVEYIDTDKERAEKFRRLYVNRMANVFYTFTPVFDKIGVLNRALDNDVNCAEQYKVDGHKQLIKEIREKLKENYEADSSYSKQDIEASLAKFDKLTERINHRGKIFIIGGLADLFDKDDPVNNARKEWEERNQKHPEKVLNEFNSYEGGIVIDANGKVYASNFTNRIPIDLQFNFNNKYKKTPEIFGVMDKVLTTDELWQNNLDYLYKPQKKKGILSRLFAVLNLIKNN